MSQPLIYQLRFEPIFHYWPWGGRSLEKRLGFPLPGDGLIGEDWLLSEREGHPSVVASVPIDWQTIAQLMAELHATMLVIIAACFRSFPLLLKILDAREALLVQVHPSDRQADYLPASETGKTEAWVVLETGVESLIYAGQPRVLMCIVGHGRIVHNSVNYDISTGKKWDADYSKRRRMTLQLNQLIPEFSVRFGGATTIDVTKPGIDKAYGIRKLLDTLGISIQEMIFVGDALFPGGNDYPAKEARVVSIKIRDPRVTKRVIEAITACFADASSNPKQGWQAYE